MMLTKEQIQKIAQEILARNKEAAAAPAPSLRGNAATIGPPFMSISPGVKNPMGMKTPGMKRPLTANSSMSTVGGPSAPKATTPI